MGYALAGTIVDAGPAARAAGCAPGDRAFVAAPHAEYAVADVDDGTRFLRVPSHMPWDRIAFLGVSRGPVAWAISSGARPDDTVVVLGQGLVGNLVMQAHRARGVGRVLTVDALDLRVRLSRELGADVAIDASRVDAVAVVRRLTAGRGADVVVDCVGGPPGVSSFASALEMVKADGVVHLIGLYHGRPLPSDSGLRAGEVPDRGLPAGRAPRAVAGEDGRADRRRGDPRGAADHAPLSGGAGGRGLLAARPAPRSGAGGHPGVGAGGGRRLAHSAAGRKTWARGRGRGRVRLGMVRRRLLGTGAAGAAGGLGALLAACQPGAATGTGGAPPPVAAPVALLYWSQRAPGDRLGNGVKAGLDDDVARNPGRVTIEAGENGAVLAMEKLKAALAAAVAPDLYGGLFQAQAAELLLIGGVVDLNTELKADREWAKARGELSPAVVEGSGWQGQAAVPADDAGDAAARLQQAAPRPGGGGPASLGLHLERLPGDRAPDGQPAGRGALPLPVRLERAGALAVQQRPPRAERRPDEGPVRRAGGGRDAPVPARAGDPQRAGPRGAV